MQGSNPKRFNRKPKVKTAFHIKIDAEERKSESEKGLDTQVPSSVNDEWCSFEKLSGEVNTLTIPPCEYGRKTENKKISRS